MHPCIFLFQNDAKLLRLTSRMQATLSSASDPNCYDSKHYSDFWAKQEMNFSTFFSKQARRPEGLFGRIVMRIVFDKGNAFLNNFVSDLMSVQTDDRIIEIGSGTGKLIYKMAKKMDKGLIEGVDFSSAMVSVAKKRNKNNIAKGKVKILEGNFDNIPYH